jgi:BNR repeat protein
MAPRGLLLIAAILAVAGCITDNPDPPLAQRASPLVAAPASSGAAPPVGDGATPASSMVVRFDGRGAVLDGGTPMGRPWAHRIGLPGGEPSLGITSRGTLLMTGSDDLTARSADGGLTWEVVHDFTMLAGGTDVFDTRDPMLWVDPLTDRIYLDHLYPGTRSFTNATPFGVSACTSLFTSDDEGATWTHHPAGCLLPGMDHQKIASGPPAAAAARPPTSYPTVLYLCYKQQAALGFLRSVATDCAVSHDGGASWTGESTVADKLRDGGCGGINGQPAIAPDGTVVVPLVEGCGRLMLAVSRDSGLTWTTVQGPPSVGAEGIDAEVDYAPDGALLAAWTGRDHLPYLARSNDHGATWSDPWKASPPGVTATAFTTVQAGTGRAALAFLGTRDAPEGTAADDAPSAARWHLFIVTADLGQLLPEFTAFQVTSDEEPVQIGCIFQGLADTCRNLLDFIDSAVNPDGTFFVAFTDGCAEDCDGQPEADADDSHSRQMAIAALAGWDTSAR